VTSDFEIEPGLCFGNWLRGEIAKNVFIEQNGFMPDRVRRVAARLQHDRPAGERLTVEVPWLRIFTAFTAPGRYIYFSRRVLERCPDDETAAFVIAHEIAHHDLGHLNIFRGFFARHALRMQPAALTVAFFHTLKKRVYSPAWEGEADRRAIELCVAAGYDGRRCLHLFKILEDYLLDFGDFTGVYGLDAESDEELSAEASLVTRSRIRMLHLRRGYLPVQDRRAMVAKHLDSVVAARAPFAPDA
jgi:predicted Zn-dependent protease